VLSEAVWLDEKPLAVVVGIGVNVASSSVPPPHAVHFPADCIENVLGEGIDRALLLASIVRALADRRAALGSSQFLSDWQGRLAFINSEVILSGTGSEPFSALLVGIARMEVCAFAIKWYN